VKLEVLNSILMVLKKYKAGNDKRRSGWATGRGKENTFYARSKLSDKRNRRPKNDASRRAGIKKAAKPRQQETRHGCMTVLTVSAGRGVRKA